ncbi:hypothetical protein KKH56_04425 [bacterium]|nr:hypothetical protein [bacterium]
MRPSNLIEIAEAIKSQQEIKKLDSFPSIGIDKNHTSLWLGTDISGIAENHSC